MKRNWNIFLISALILAAGLSVAGCVSDSGTSQAVTTTAPADSGSPADLQDGNMNAQPPSGMQAGNLTGQPPNDMEHGNMTGHPPNDIQAGNVTGPDPAGTPPAMTPSS